jgi:isopenicillin-N epimerase
MTRKLPHRSPDDSPPDSHPATHGLSRRDLLTVLGAGSALTLASPALRAQPQELPDSSRQMWAYARSQQVLEPGLAWLDTARMGPTLRGVLVNEYRAREALNMDFARYSRRSFDVASVESLLGSVARTIGAGVDELAFTIGASGAIDAAVHGIELQPGDEVVTTSQDHPALSGAWAQRVKRDGIVLREVPLPSPLTGPEQALGLIAGAVTDRTRVISFAHVQYTDGAVLPVREICTFARQRGILTLVDGAQALGMIELSLGDLGCDCYAASLHKWVNAAYGTGLLYVRRDALERVHPLEADGSETFDEPDDPRRDWPAAMRRYGHAYRYFGPLFQPIESLLAFQNQIGRERIEARIRELAIYARLRLQSLSGIELVTPAAPGLWAGILSMRVAAPTAVQLAAALADQDRVVVGVTRDPAGGNGLLRVSTHIYNTHDEIERLVRGLQRRI